MAHHDVEVHMFRCELRELPAPVVVAEALRVPAGTPVQRLDRVRGWDGLPVLRSRSWFHPRVTFPKDESFARPLYDIVAEVSGRSADRASEAFIAVAATDALAKDLKIKKHSPVLLRRHTVFDTQARPLEFAEVHYVSERFTLTLDLKRE
jgi:GntR family transcriptional regulator